jgi:hypothetical protein
VKLSLRGKEVTALNAGRYTLVVTDHSPRSGFVLEHGTSKALWVTTRAFVGRHTETVRLTQGKWSFGAGAKTYFTVS